MAIFSAVKTGEVAHDDRLASHEEDLLHRAIGPAEGGDVGIKIRVLSRPERSALTWAMRFREVVSR